MKKTKTQAQKQADRDERVKAKNAEQEKIKAAHIAQIQKQLQESQSQDDESKSTDKKALRKQRKDVKKQWSLPAVKSSTTVSSITDEIAGGNPSPSSTSHSVTPTVEEVTAKQAVDDVKQEMLAAVTKNDPPTIVINHSTFCEGLMSVIARLERMNLPKCTIVPGTISQGKIHAGEFELRFQRIENTTTYKFVARKGYTIQDVSIIVSDPAIFTEELACDAVKRAIENKAEKSDIKSADSDISYGNYNRTAAYERDKFWRKTKQEEDQQLKTQEQARKRQQKVDTQSKKLANKGLNRDSIKDFAERDFDIINGDNHTRNSMK